VADSDVVMKQRCGVKGRWDDALLLSFETQFSAV